MSEDCVFCKIVEGKIPSTKLYEDSNTLAFLDIMPAAKGHALIVPKKHFHTLLDIPHPELEQTIKIVQKVGAAIMVSLKADGFNVLQSNHQAAGQVIPHIHFHVIPRRQGDGLKVEKWEQSKVEQAELQEYAKAIKKHL